MSRTRRAGLAPLAAHLPQPIKIQDRTNLSIQLGPRERKLMPRLQVSVSYGGNFDDLTSTSARLADAIRDPRKKNLGLVPGCRAGRCELIG